MSNKVQVNKIQIRGLFTYDTKKPKPVLELEKTDLEEMRKELQSVLHKYAKPIDNHEINVLFNFNHQN